MSILRSNYFAKPSLSLPVIALSMMASAALAHEQTHSHQVAAGEEGPTIAATPLNDTLTMLSGVGGFTGGNVIVSNGPDGMLIIDDKVPQLTDALIAALNDVGDAGALKYVINTHWHFDHTGGNATLGETATIVAHENVRARLSAPQKIDFFGAEIPAAPESARPDVTFAQSISLHFNGEELQLTHFPDSHTDTDSVIYFTQSNVLHMGDLFFAGMFPFVDVQNAGNVQGMADAAQTILDTYPADVTIVPGHGPLATMEDLKTFRQMLLDSLAHVQAMIDDGKSLEEIQAAGVPEQWQSWAAIIDPAGWNGIVYASLTK